MAGKLNVAIELLLEDCEAATAEVYGKLKASQLSSTWTFFDVKEDDRVTVPKGQLIPLDPSSVHATENLPLTLTALLYDDRQGTPGTIADGTATFTVVEGTYSAVIKGQYGSVKVTITA